MAPTGSPNGAVVFGPATLDRYPATGDVVPGGPALNVAWHWSQLGRDVELVSRIGDDGELVVGWLEAHGVVATPSLRVPGRTCSIDVEFAADRQPIMSGFDPGVWDDVALTDDEIDRMRTASCTHAILTEAVIDELLTHIDPLPSLSADFLTSTHVDDDRFEQLIERLDIAFVGWPGSQDDDRVGRLESMARAAGTTLVVTFGSKGIHVVGPGGRRRFDVDRVEVVGTTIGCGDAFIAAFLDRWIDERCDIESAVAAGAARGAAATAWDRPLPPNAY